MDRTACTTLILGILILSSSGYSMQAQQTTEPTQQSTKQLLDCRRMINADIFPSETCSVILTYLSPTDKIGPVNEDGSFMVLSPLPDGTTDLKTYQFPPKLRSVIALNRLTQTIQDAQYADPSALHGLFAELAVQGISFWPKLRDVYCYYHPEGTYIDLSEHKQKCRAIAGLPNEKTLESEFEGAEIFDLNYRTLLNTMQAENMANGNDRR